MALIIVDTFQKFVVAADQFVQDAPPEWRVGQSLFNLLRRVRPDLSDLISGSDFDPFYVNDHIPAFYSYLARHWDDRPCDAFGTGCGGVMSDGHCGTCGAVSN